MIPKFRVSKRDNFWVLEVFYITQNDQQPLFDDWEGFEEPFSEDDYQKMQHWCYNTFKTWLTPQRAKRMSYNQFWFKSKKDADWFMLYWGGVDISVE
jgi:hypothetical protein